MNSEDMKNRAVLQIRGDEVPGFITAKIVFTVNGEMVPAQVDVGVISRTACDLDRRVYDEFVEACDLAKDVIIADILGNVPGVAIKETGKIRGRPSEMN